MAKALSQSSFSQAELDPDELRQLLHMSSEFFIEYFIGDQIAETDRVQDFHLITFDRFIDMNVTRDVAALPRDHAKTTYLRLAMVKVMAFTRVQFFVYMGATHGAGASSISVIRNYLLSDEFMDAFGAVQFAVDRPSEGHIEFWMTAYIPTYDDNGQLAGLEPLRKLVILKALGVQQALRGMNLHNLRPQYVGCDDIEDETAVKTEEGYLKLKGWFDNTFMRAVSRQTGLNKVAQIGNLIGLQTLLNDNLMDPDWRGMRLGILRKDGEPLWPDRFSKEAIRADLMRAKRRGQLSAWFGELMNMPLNLETSLIDYDLIKYTARRHPGDGHKYHTFITIDPAVSKSTTADDAAIVLHTIDRAGVPQATEYVYGRMGVDGICDAVKMLCQKWDCHVVGCESVQLQVILLDYLRLAFAVDNMVDYDFVPIEIGQSWKTGRLKVWAAALGEGEYTLPEDDWDMVQQLINFDTRKENNKDDLIDAGSMGLYMLKNYMDLIMQDRLGQVALITPPPANSTLSI